MTVHCGFCGSKWNHRENCPKRAKWLPKEYEEQHKFTPVEEYLIGKLERQPTLVSGLDDIYKRNPVRWHQIIAAAMLRRRESPA